MMMSTEKTQVISLYGLDDIVRRESEYVYDKKR